CSESPPLLSTTYPPPPPLSTLSLHAALPIYHLGDPPHHAAAVAARPAVLVDVGLVGSELRGQGRADPLRQLRIRADHFAVLPLRSEEHTSELQSRSDLVCRLLLEKKKKKQ